MNQAELPPGTLEMPILKRIRGCGPSHGYAIAKASRQSSQQVLRVEEGSLYPAGQRIPAKGLVTAQRVQAGPKRRNRMDQLTPEGRKQLSAEISASRRGAPANERVIEPA
jgi:DNA-binding PadR family transcriptional regulator